MKLNSILLSLALALSVLAAMPHSVSASANTKLDLIQDLSSGGVGVLDMDGPTGFGFVNFNQDADYRLRVVVSLKNAEPDTEYKGIFTVCGPTHAAACGYIDIGNLTTNGQGNGNTTMFVSVADLQAAFGSGAKTDHFDLMKDVGDLSAGVYTATGLDYMVP